ncbi:MAG TPA: mechanosensitive ion channel domain-containing protein [Sulfolobales archaeon]|nr:mechanosensitive ion channel domain-containing protein [Sulfolobales archaeon]
MKHNASIAREFRNSVMMLIIWVVIYLIISALINGYLLPLLSREGVEATQYAPYINIALALAFGYMIVRALANTIYWSLRARYEHPQAAAVRSVMIIIGIGALLAGIAGGVAGGAAGVALGGFLGIVVGFASQQVLSQAVAGLFLLLARPVSIGDRVTIAGETGAIEDISSLFIKIRKDDGTLMLIPNNMAIGAKIQIIKKYGET